MRKNVLSNKKKRKNQKNGEIKNYIFSVTESLLILTLLLLISAFVCYQLDINRSYYYIILIGVCVLSCFISGMLTYKKLKKPGIVCGFIGSLPICIVVCVTSTLLCDLSFSIKIIIAAVLMLLSGAIAGIFCSNMRR